MSRIFVTGDTHGGQAGDLSKLNSKRFPEGKTLTKNDYVIVVGDFGIPFYPEGNRWWKEEEYYRKWLDKKPWTTLFIDGNHDNHDKLALLPRIDMFGDIVGQVSDSIFHLKRGRVYEIHGKRFFTMGGALSIDQGHRTQGLDWWPQEIPSVKQMDTALDSLEKHNHEVDYVLSHTGPIKTVLTYGTMYKYDVSYRHKDPVPDFLQYVADTTKFKKWYFGHWHRDWDYFEYRMLYNDVVEVDLS